MKALRWLWILPILLFGCSESDSPATPADAMTAGWSAYARDDYTAAAAQFSVAIAADESNGEAHMGLGFAYARLDSLEMALAAFETALALEGEWAIDCHAGRAVVLRDLEPVDHAAALNAVQTALSFDATYAFSHDPCLTWHTLRLIAAHCHFALGAYAEAQDQAVLIGGQAQDPNAPTFVEDLLEELEHLGAIWWCNW